MRILGNQYIQNSLGEKQYKSPNELIAELTVIKKTVKIKRKGKIIKIQKRKYKKKELAIALHISNRTLASYKQYFASIDNPSLKLNKNDRKAPSKVILRLRQIAQNNKIKIKRNVSRKYDKSDVETLKTIITKSFYNKFKHEMFKEKPTWKGWLTRIHFSVITREGTFTNDYLTYLSSKNTYKELNNFLVEQFYKKIMAINSLLGFEIIEVINDVTLNEYTPNIKKPKK